MATTVGNKKQPSTPNDVYVGRPTKWGNPYSHQDGTLARYRVKDRAAAIRAFEEGLLMRPALLMAARRELKGKRLVCWCHPLPCHAHVLALAADLDVWKNEAGKWCFEGEYHVEQHATEGGATVAAFEYALACRNRGRVVKGAGA